MPNESAIKKMKRGELNELAAEYGINPDEFRKADDLRSAIFAYLKDQEKKATAKADDADQNKPEQETEEKEVQKPKQKPNPPKPRIQRRSRRYRTAHEQIDKAKTYPLTEAMKLCQKTSTVKFDAAVELHLLLGVDPKQSDQLVRGTVSLPHGSGKSQRVAAIAPKEMHEKIKKAGADEVGYEDVLDNIGNGKLDFDILVVHPDAMKDLSRHAKVLGPQGLMPSPKAGTVTEEVARTVKELKSGRVEYRVDRYGIIHQIVGRVSFKPEQLEANVKGLMAAITASRPSGTKGTYLKKAYLTTSMGPSIKLDIATLT